jgi:hypothetical protein
MTFLFRTVHMTYLLARVQELHQKRSLQPRGRSPVMQIVPWFSITVTKVLLQKAAGRNLKECVFCFLYLVIVEISLLGYTFIFVAARGRSRVKSFLEYSRL